MSRIHPTATVTDGAVIAESASVGPYSVIGGGVTLSAGVNVMEHVSIAGNTAVGENCTLYPFASIGHAPQDMKYKGEDSRLEIGPRCVIREHVTMNPGTDGGGMITKTGSDCLFMVGSHVAHDCIVGDHVILSNNATLAGHCQIGDFTIFGGLSACQQFTRTGRHAFIGGMSGVERDVLPFALVFRNPARLAGPNAVGLKRHGFSRPRQNAIKSAFDAIFSDDGTLARRVDRLASDCPDNPDVSEIVQFIREGGGRSLCSP